METLARDTPAPSRIWLAVALIAWLTVILGYWTALAAHSLTPGTLQAPPSLESADFTISNAGLRHCLVMAVHPKCPCTRASAEQLSRLIARFREQLHCVVLVYKPANESDDWTDTNLIKSLSEQPGTRLLVDVNGQKALKLGMSTSGAVILYSPQGRARYWGGITAARGHAGDNLGADAIASVLNGSPPEDVSQPVYGCHIQGATAKEEQH
jgi:hypothetical protein